LAVEARRSGSFCKINSGFFIKIYRRGSVKAKGRHLAPPDYLLNKLPVREVHFLHLTILNSSVVKFGNFRERLYASSFPAV
jgi:hypothetical protein